MKPYVAPPAPTPSKEETEKVTIFSSSGDVVRAYSRTSHGDDYAEMAEEFVKNHAKRGYRLGSLKDK